MSGLTGTDLLVWHNEDALTLSIDRPHVDALWYCYPVDFDSQWDGQLGTVVVRVSGVVEAILRNPGQQVALNKLPERTLVILKQALVFDAALRVWPGARQVDITSEELPFDRLLKVSCNHEELVARLAQLLLRLDDRELIPSVLGAALSLGASLAALRRAGRVLLRDGFVVSSPGLFRDAKLEHFDPKAGLEVVPATRDRLLKCLHQRKHLAALPVRFDFTRLHPVVQSAAKPDFEAGNLAMAQLAALREVNLAARQKSGIAEERDGGAKMMGRLFARKRDQFPSQPWLRVTDGTDNGDNFQDGIQRLFEGAQKLTNPVRHGRDFLGTEIDEAFEFLVLASMLMRVVDRAEVVFGGD